MVKEKNMSEGYGIHLFELDDELLCHWLSVWTSFCDVKYRRRMKVKICLKDMT